MSLCEMLNTVSSGLRKHSHSISVIEFDLNNALEEAEQRFQSKTNNEGGE